MSAITEIPAKTPKPIGSTCNFFPGSVKGAADALAVVSAAAVPVCAVEVVDVDVKPDTADASIPEDELDVVEVSLAPMLELVDVVLSVTESVVETESVTDTDVVPITDMAALEVENAPAAVVVNELSVTDVDKVAPVSVEEPV